MRVSSPLPSDFAERPEGRQLLVVSHPAVVDVNQEVYLELQRRGWMVRIVVRSRWRHEYSDKDVAPKALPGLESALRPTPIVLPGRPQRHVYLTRATRFCAALRPDAVFLEADPY